jgi:hypothetical protein
VAGGVQHLEPLLADDQRFAIIDMDIHEGCRAGPMHDDRQVKLRGQLAAGREVVGVGVRIEDVAHLHAVLAGAGQISVDEVDFRIDQQRHGALLAAHQIGQAATIVELFENHCDVLRQVG